MTGARSSSANHRIAQRCKTVAVVEARTQPENKHFTVLGYCNLVGNPVDFHGIRPGSQVRCLSRRQGLGGDVAAWADFGTVHSYHDRCRPCWRLSALPSALPANRKAGVRLSLPAAYFDPAFIACMQEVIDTPEMVESASNRCTAAPCPRSAQREPISGPSPALSTTLAACACPDEAIHSLRAQTAPQRRRWAMSDLRATSPAAFSPRSRYSSPSSWDISARIAGAVALPAAPFILLQ